MIQGERVCLKPFTKEMYRQYYNWRMDDEVMYWAAGVWHRRRARDSFIS
ncbi:hypothetical protein [Alicyclobacillus acidiphilus]|nr:hypothetical protein [Alicyclobacillus acidiphilus]